MRQRPKGTASGNLGDPLALAAATVAGDVNNKASRPFRSTSRSLGKWILARSSKRATFLVRHDSSRSIAPEGSYTYHQRGSLSRRMATIRT